MKPSLYEQFSARIPGLRLLAQEPLADHTSFRIGGPAELMLCPYDAAQLAQCLRLCGELGIVPRILGAGTNVLAPDEGLPGVVLSTRGLTALTSPDRTGIEAQCGVPLARLANYALRLGLTGLEFAHGIPGTVGGGVYMNAGAYGGEMIQVAEQTTVMYPDGSTGIFCGEEQGFGYRRSAFMDRQCIVLQCRFRLTPGDPAQIRARMRELGERRRASQPLDLPSAGSTFKRPVGGYAAALIDEAGLRGFRVGGAAVSGKHTGFVVNLGGATAADVRELMRQIQEKVLDRSGIRLEPEVRLWEP